MFFSFSVPFRFSLPPTGFYISLFYSIISFFQFYFLLTLLFISLLLDLGTICCPFLNVEVYTTNLGLPSLSQSLF